MKSKKTVKSVFVLVGFSFFVSCGDQVETRKSNTTDQRIANQSQHDDDALPETDEVAPGDETPDLEPIPTTTSSPAPIPTPDQDPDNGSEPAQLTGEQNFILKDSNEKAMSLNEYFKGSYLILDLSSSSCGACVSLAQEKDTDIGFQNMFVAGKCTFAALVTKRDLTSWLGNFSVDGFLSSHSFAVDLSHQAMAEAFGFTLEYIPTILLIDRKGNLLQGEVGSIPSRVNELCK